MKILAFDTSTQTLGVALAIDEQTYFIEDEGGAKASDTLLKRIDALLKEHSITLKELDALAFGAGPGAFTGLRTAASAAQGMALGANLPVIPVITLKAGAQQYLMNNAEQFKTAAAADVLVKLDARMNEWYWAHYRWADKAWQTITEPTLSSPEELQTYTDAAKPALKITLEGTQLQGMLELAKLAWQNRETVTAAEALPLYLRNKVAQTTAERMEAKAKLEQE